MTSWALQDAKARFSAVVEQAQREGPQWVTRRGEDAVVVVAVDQFQELTRRHGRGDLVRFFRESPLTDLSADWLRRVDDTGRDVAL